MTCDFGIQHYQEILNIALSAQYRFIHYDELSSLPSNEYACILRHDVDYMPGWAIGLGEVERDLGIEAAYFFQVCARPYNLRETEIRRSVHELRKLGHRIGLHFDVEWKKNIQWQELASLCEEDKRLFESIAGIRPCEIVSFHNPHRFRDNILNRQILGIRHTYEREYFSDIKYLSDSQGWREGCVCKIFGERRYRRIQLLIHPHAWPKMSAGDFVSAIAHMVKCSTEELLEYLIHFNPVCKENESRLRQEVLGDGLIPESGDLKRRL